MVDTLVGAVATGRADHTPVVEAFRQTLAEAVLADGVDVVIADVNDAAARAVGEELGAQALHVDVTDEAQANAFVTRARDELGGLDILVNNAGGPPPGDFRD